MKSNLRFRAITIVAVILVCIYGIIGLPTSIQELKDNWNKNIRLGLDLKGGSQLTLQVQLQDAFKADADQVILHLKEALAKTNVTYTEMAHSDPQSIADADKIEIDIKGVPAPQGGNFRQIVQENFSSEWILSEVNPTDYRMTMQPTAALKLKDDTLTQSIQTIDKKINGLGLSETSVQKRGGSTNEAEIMVQLPGVDDPAHVKQLLKTQAVLELDEVKSGPFPTREEARASTGGILPLDSKVVPQEARGGAPSGLSPDAICATRVLSRARWGDGKRRL
jgi:preprotein translocase subunit SecD